MLVKRLNCRIRVVNPAGGPKSAGRTNTKPELKYVKETPIAPAEPTKAEPQDEGQPRELEPKKVDPKQVADQVYELMLQEARQIRLRRGI